MTSNHAEVITNAEQEQGASGPYSLARLILAAGYRDLDPDEPPATTLAQAIDTLPKTNDEYFAWLRERGLSLSAGPAVYVSAVRDDLRKLAGGSSC